MDLLTIIGNATADDTFRKQLFKDPLKTVKRYGFHLTKAEQTGLEKLTQGKDASANEEYLGKVYTCPHKPCPFALRRPGGEQKIA